MADQLLLGAGPAPLPSMVTCFSLHQPYAGLVAAGLKTLETRLFAWPVKARPYPSPLLICSTQSADIMASATLRTRMPDAERFDLTLWRPGVALCVVDVVGCRPLTAEDEPRAWFWDPEEQRRGVTRWAWDLVRVRRVAPFAVRGRQGFAKAVPREQVEKALAARKEQGHVV